MGYKVNPLSLQELRALAVQRLRSPVAQDCRVLTPEQVANLVEEVTISKLEIEIQNEYLQEACSRLEVTLNEATNLYDFAPVACVSVDLAGIITKLNLSGANLLGQERHRLIGSDFTTFFLPAQRVRIHALMQQANLSGEDLQQDLTLECGREIIKHVQLLLSPMGGAQGYQMVLNDITRYKETQDELRSTDERWKSALDAAGDGVWDWDVLSDTVHYSPKLVQLYGCSAEQFGGTMESWRTRVHPKDWAGLLAALQRCLLGPDTWFNNAYRERCKDGEWKWVQCQGAVFARDDSGKVVRMIGTHSDTAQCKHLEAALLEMASIQQAVLESVPQYLAVLDAQGRVMQTNAVWSAYGLAHGLAYHGGYANVAYADLLDAVTGGVEQSKRAALAGIAEVTSGNAPRFHMEYTFQTGMQLHCFAMNVMAVRDGRARAVVSHQDISQLAQRVLALGAPKDASPGLRNDLA